LLHLVDLGPLGNPVRDVATIAAELREFSPELAARTRWLVLNKADLVPEDQRASLVSDIVATLDWQGPVFMISAAQRYGTDELVEAVMHYLERRPREPGTADEEDPAV